MSRITLHRIEKGNPSVTMGAYLSAIDALGLQFIVDPTNETAPEPEIEQEIVIAEYPFLKRLSWQLGSLKTLSPKEALAIYERNWKFVNPEEMTPKERQLIECLLRMHGKKRLLV